MPGILAPQAGIQGFWATIQALASRITAIETRERQIVAMVPGTVTQWGGVGVPGGALACNGATVSAVTYPTLWYAQGNVVAPVSGDTVTLPSSSGSPISVIWT